jgi:hypothetical protein
MPQTWLDLALTALVRLPQLREALPQSLFPEDDRQIASARDNLTARLSEIETEHCRSAVRELIARWDRSLGSLPDETFRGYVDSSPITESTVLEKRRSVVVRRAFTTGGDGIWLHFADKCALVPAHLSQFCELLIRGQPFSVAELAHDLRVAATELLEIATHLERDGLLVRGPQDRPARPALED